MDIRNKDREKSGLEVHVETNQLVRQCIDGDYEAFGKLYTCWVMPIYRYVFYQVKDKMTAEDITEEVFMKAWQAIGSCKGKEATFSSWLYRIAHNQVVDVFRHEQRQVSLEATAIDCFPSVTPDMGVNLQLEEILQEIAGMPQSQKQVLLLKFIEGLSNPEISQIMGKSEGAIRILQMRALQTLRSKFPPEDL
ncbi:MAG: sigma-70 family RNA polymerase sigma factor [Chloroflexi bacterium]|nr:sigma-70 family RNA polymerase sigma factor [Chloroflexota bacterium]